MPILFAYGGWQNANYVAEEIDEPAAQSAAQPARRHARGGLIYVTVNVVYLRALGLDGLAATTTPASTRRRMFGALGDGSSPRRSRFRPSASSTSRSSRRRASTTRWRGPRVPSGAVAAAPRYRTPWVAILIQSTWSCVLALTGRYGQLLNYVVFADWIFFGLTVATVLVFRRTHPLAARPPGAFRAPGYPVVPVAFVLVAAAVVASVVWRIRRARSAARCSSRPAFRCFSGSAAAVARRRLK